jgi:hypothetical protein
MATCIKKYKNLPINKSEILRYLNSNTEDSKISKLIEDCIKELEGKLRFDVCYSEFQVAFNDNFLDLGFAVSTSQDLKKNLKGCKKIVLFAATIGVEIDRLIARYGKVSPLKALVLQAIGTERIETLCDAFCNDIAKEYKGFYLKPRFSAGYGDLPLAMQNDVFKALDCAKNIGLTLNSSLLMSPSKSVTAIVGISQCQVLAAQENCNICNKKDCIFRRNV